jgi:hypothetical protein
MNLHKYHFILTYKLIISTFLFYDQHIAILTLDAGICDDNIAMCYCPPETKYGLIPAPEGSLPGAAPLRLGRPLYNCNPKEVGIETSCGFSGLYLQLY